MGGFKTGHWCWLFYLIWSYLGKRRVVLSRRMAALRGWLSRFVKTCRSGPQRPRRGGRLTAASAKTTAGGARARLYRVMTDSETKRPTDRSRTGRFRGRCWTINQQARKITSTASFVPLDFWTHFWTKPHFQRRIRALRSSTIELHPRNLTINACNYVTALVEPHRRSRHPL